MITKRIETHVEPEHSYELHYYCCPVCPAEFEEEADAQRHYGEKHAVRARVALDHQTTYLLLTPEDYKLWLCSYRGEGFDEVSEGGWEGPGWYLVQSKSVPCRKGCCYRMRTEAVSLNTVVGETLYKIQQQQRYVEALEAVVALGLAYRNDESGQDPSPMG